MASTMSQGGLTREQIAAHGEELYRARIMANVEAQHLGRMLVLDIESGDYEIDDSGRAAAHRLRQRRPAADLYALRVGHEAVGRIGGRRPVGTE